MTERSGRLPLRKPVMACGGRSHLGRSKPRAARSGSPCAGSGCGSGTKSGPSTTPPNTARTPLVYNAWRELRPSAPSVSWLITYPALLITRAGLGSQLSASFCKHNRRETWMSSHLPHPDEWHVPCCWVPFGVHTLPPCACALWISLAHGIKEPPWPTCNIMTDAPARSMQCVTLATNFLPGLPSAPTPRMCGQPPQALDATQAPVRPPSPNHRRRPPTQPWEEPPPSTC